MAELVVYTSAYYLPSSAALCALPANAQNYFFVSSSNAVTSALLCLFALCPVPGGAAGAYEQTRCRYVALRECMILFQAAVRGALTRSRIRMAQARRISGRVGTDDANKSQ